MLKNESFDSLLRQALLLAAIEDVKGIADAEQADAEMEFSPEYLRNRMRLLADPFRYAKRKLRPMWKKALKSAACLLLVCSLAFATLMIASPSARAAVKQWFIEWYETYIVYRFAGEAETDEMPQYEIGALPEGYAEVSRNVAPGYVKVIYENAVGEIIFFTYMQMQHGMATATELTDMAVTDIEVNGHLGQFFWSNDSEQSNAIAWVDELVNLYFNVDMFGENEDVLHIAESVGLAK